MRLEESSWLPLAKQLRPGEKRRVSHDCAADRSMIVNAGEQGWSAHCFRCGSGFVPYPAPSLEEQLSRLRVQQQADEQARQSIALPSGANYEVETWPMNCKVWLYKSGFTVPEIKGHGWYYSQALDRVILPVWKNGSAIFWQGRNCTDKLRPKYLAPSVDRSRIAWHGGAGPVLALTEDILSAAKVSRHTEARSIMGTKLPGPLLADIVVTGKPVLVWLDPDLAGKAGAATIANVLRSVGCKVAIAQSQRDPKLHCNKEIQDVLSAADFH